VSEIPFTRPFLAETELGYVRLAAEAGLESGGTFTQRCERWLQERSGAERALLSHSGTGALEAAMILAGIGPGDEVLMPSFAYPTMATAVVRQGSVPVFVDIDPDTLNVDPDLVKAAVGPNVKAIVAVHYGGVSCEMDALLAIAESSDLVLVEDAAHCLLASYGDRPLGSIGDLGTFSFHHTKNVTCGEGGALLVNNPALVERAEVIWEKGTDRGRFLRGEVNRYSWVDVGSSFGASEISAAFLWGQLEAAEEVTSRRRAIWDRYHEAFAGIEAEGLARRPHVAAGHTHNGHLYYLVLPTTPARDAFIEELRGRGIVTSFHYVPLHSAPAGRAFGRTVGEMTHTDELSRRLVRLPLWPDLDEEQIERVIDASRSALTRASPPSGRTTES
jgi:dTDP-4-amino-4,6-dideoxygalactose transaminase